MKSLINEYVGDLTEMLVKNKISEANRKLFKQGLINDLSGKLNQVVIAIESHAIDEIPTGHTMQWSLFKTNFELTFSDSYFNQMLADIRQVTNHKNGICNSSIPIVRFSSLISDIKLTLELAPEEKGQAKNVELEKIDSLKSELNFYKDSVKEIVNLLKP